MSESLADRIKRKLGTVTAGQAAPTVPQGTVEPKKKRKWVPLTPDERDSRLARKGRLPDLSSFLAVYNADKEEWSGTLTVQGHEPFRSTASGVFRLLYNLDELYRAALGERP